MVEPPPEGPAETDSRPPIDYPAHTPTLSVVVPALNEAQRLPSLLESLKRQTRPPDQVIVADAGSSDDTREIALAWGAEVVGGGRPAAGRNAGAAAARGDLVLFVDADVNLEEDMLERALGEYAERGLTVATAHLAPIERTLSNEFACDVANFYLDAMQYAVPHAPGFFILVRREVHEEIGGFDESLVLAEDHEYVARAAKLGKFRVLRCCPVATSMRRIEKEGLVRLAFMYLYCEVHVVAGQPIREVPFDYDFAAFTPVERSEYRPAIEELRVQLRDIAEKVLASSSDGFESLRELGSSALDGSAIDRLLRELPSAEIKQMERYLGARARLARRAGRHGVKWLRSVGIAIWRESGEGRGGDEQA